MSTKRYTHSKSRFGVILNSTCVFFYIEECYHPQSTATGRSRQSTSCLQVCEAVTQFNKTLLNSSSEVLRVFHNVTRLCVESNCIDEVKGQYPDLGCKVTFVSVSKWMEYCVTVAFTIGMFLRNDPQL